MPAAHDAILQQVADALMESAGFARDAVLRDYCYADYLGEGQELRRVDLAAFAETPPSYRSACIGLQRLAADRPSTTKLDSLRALGARRIIALGPTQASIWSADRGQLEKLGEHPLSEVPQLIRTRAAEWSAHAILRARGIAPVEHYQLDLGDLGLIPLIEHQVNTKLDRLIREVLAGCVERDSKLSSGRAFHRLLRLVFWLLAAKVLADREHPGLLEPPRTAGQAVRAAHRHYGRAATSDEDVAPEPALRLADTAVAEWAWQKIHRGFHFQNLSVDALAFVYENTLVSADVRQQLGIHGTPRGIAELVADLLPLEELPPGQDVILEPCAGFGPFLLAALRKLRARALVGLDPHERHVELVKRLRGVELDPFAVEVGKLCLTLADYPSPDGWQLHHDDVFAPGVIENFSSSVGAVLANPPFETFSRHEKQRYGAVRTEKPAELLRRVLAICSPQLLGMILPRVVLESDRQGYRELRDAVGRQYREVDRIDLPDNLFQHSDAESVLLIARSRRPGNRTVLRSSRLPASLVDAALAGRWTPQWACGTLATERDDSSFSVDELAEVWARLERAPRLEAVAELHRGIEYHRSLHEETNELVSTTRQPGMAAGVASAQDLRLYGIARRVFLSTKPDEIRRAGGYDWESPKVVLNAVRRSRGPWCLTAAPDLTGHWCYQNLFGVWPRDRVSWPVELLAAVLNGPVAAAFVAGRAGKRGIHRRVLAAVPLPDRSRLDGPAVIRLVHQAMEDLRLDAVLRIDAEILRAYDLSPRLERRLLLRFDGADRPGLPTFRGYYPAGFESALPLHRVLSDLTDERRAKALLLGVPVFDDRRVSQMFDDIAAGYGE